MSTQNKKGDVMATQLVVREMLEMMDTMDRGFGVVKAESEAEQAIMDEYKEVYQNILDTFEKLGVTQVETLGKEFDYEVHQAVMQRPSEDYEEGIVCDELQKGFMIGETLIRAAMVSVAA
jgi:molecular chaperone GrpE